MKKAILLFTLLSVLVIAGSIFAFPSVFSATGMQSQSYLRFKLTCNSSSDKNAIAYLLYDGYQDDVSRTNARGIASFPVIANSANYSYTVYYKNHQTPIKPIAETPPPDQSQMIGVLVCGRK
jgi:hypothetical protein